MSKKRKTHDEPLLLMEGIVEKAISKMSEARLLQIFAAIRERAKELKIELGQEKRKENPDHVMISAAQKERDRDRRRRNRVDAKSLEMINTGFFKTGDRVELVVRDIGAVKGTIESVRSVFVDVRWDQDVLDKLKALGRELYRRWRAKVLTKVAI